MQYKVIFYSQENEVEVSRTVEARNELLAVAYATAELNVEAASIVHDLTKVSDITVLNEREIKFWSD